MEYSRHKIHRDGYIEIRQTKDGGIFHRRVIAPNESIDSEPQDVQEAILADPNYETYRTEENAQAYEDRLSEIE